MTLSEKHQTGKFTITVELDPPKSASSRKTEEEAARIAPFVDAVNIADCPMAKLRMSPIALSSILQHKYKVETIFHLTCRDRNLIGLQAELLGAAALGVHNILTLTGDPPSVGDHPHAHAVFETDSAGLIGIARTLNEGHDMAGNALAESASFYIGTTANPGAENLEEEILRLEHKKRAGAHFVQTQPVYDIKQAELFIHAARPLELPILFGVLPLKSYRMALYLHEKVPGITIPPSLLSDMERYGKTAGLQNARNLVRALRTAGTHGAHLMPINDMDAVISVVCDA